MTAHSHARRTALAGVIGNVLEWYDFAVYGFFAVTIGKHFFPTDDPAVSVVLSFGVFAVGFLARPVGALIFGHLGDVIGRRRVLMISILMMAIPTFLIGVMPTYDTLGVFAPIILILLRLAQGASVGGELTGSVTFMLEEMSDKKTRGLAGSWSFSGAVAGVLLGSAVGTLVVSVLDADQVAAWGWRLPFLAGVVIAICGFMLRRGLEHEKPPAAAEGRSPIPLFDALREHPRDMLCAVGITAFTATGFYLMFVYITTYLTGVVGETEAFAFEMNTINMMILVVMIPVWGWLSGKIGIQKVLVGSSLVGIVASIPLFTLMDHQHHIMEFLGQFGMVMIIAPFQSCFATRMAFLFPKDLRMSAFSVTYNIGLAVFGGAAPAAAAYLIEQQVGGLSPAYLLTGAAVISFISLLAARRDEPAT
ncbi:MAG: MFS transporter [Rhodospirillaceae bacterium]|jgi:MFS transporter, MHS family, proline/betaine transporter|nr:MFS transporter [Rhodospirillaceae bacterium]MBT7614353.1 MFS transporter [Rhodospirillaceae bacterium]MBT7646549.1 MFS transporter [Rhodospirillaceae bacterium]